MFLDEDNVENNFEVFCRYRMSSSNGPELDFLFNDITRSKLNENLKSEFKYKSLFLSKVAHEFKNPLICITELVKQMICSPEFQENLLSTNFEKTISQIKSMSNFLLVLVKDLDYFSQSQTEDKINLDLKEANLDEILEFVEEITHSLLKKGNKNDQINFKVLKHEDVPRHIITDEWRLKQILINLISNAVKFTHYGEILIEVSVAFLEKAFLKFLVKDTGVGIKPELQSKLFQPFKKGININNELGAGLGLSIVNELTKKMGGAIEFKSEWQKGSSFWFHIPLETFVINNEFEEQSRELGNKKMSSVINNNIDLNSMKKEENHFSNKTKDIEFNLNKQNLDDIDFQIQPDNNKSNYSIHSNKIKIIPKKVIKKKSESLNSKGKQKLTNFSNVEINQNILCQHEQCLFHLKNSIKEKQIFNVLDLLLKDVNPLRVEPNNKRLVNVMVADDEKITRQSTMRILKEVSDTLEIKLNIIEADDGAALIYNLYKCTQQGIKISMIFSDESMNYINGSKCAQIIYDIFEDRSIPQIPFNLVTAYDYLVKNKSIHAILSKPLSKHVTEDLFKEFLELNELK